MRVDARPSDAIALALRAGASIFVDEKIVPHAITVPKEEDPELEEFRSFLENLSPDDFRRRTKPSYFA